MFTFYRNWKNSGLGIRSLVFWANHSFFVKNEQMSNSLKKMSNSHILVSEPERIAQGHSFLVSNLIKLLTVAHFWWATWAIRSQSLFCHEHLSDLLTSLLKKEGMSESLIFSKLIKNVQKIQFNSNLFERITRFDEQKSKWAICLKKKWFALFLWATWANGSWSIFCHEWPEWFAHGRSFVLSNLSDLLMSLIFS